MWYFTENRTFIQSNHFYEPKNLYLWLEVRLNAIVGNDPVSVIMKLEMRKIWDSDNISCFLKCFRLGITDMVERYTMHSAFRHRLC